MNDSSDIASARAPKPVLTPFDPQGQAAFLVVESLMHVLIEKGMFVPDDAIDVLNSAISIKHEIAARGEEPAEAANASLVLLERLVKTFASATDGQPDTVGD